MLFENHRNGSKRNIKQTSQFLINKTELPCIYYEIGRDEETKSLNNITTTKTKTGGVGIVIAIVLVLSENDTKMFIRTPSQWSEISKE